MTPPRPPAFLWWSLLCGFFLPLTPSFSNDTSSQPIVADFVPPGAKAVLVLRPRMLLSRLPDEGTGAAMYARELQRISFPPPLLVQVSRIIESTGLLLNDVEEIGVVFGVHPPIAGPKPEDANADEADLSPLPPDFMFVLRFRKALPDDIPAVLLHRPTQYKLTNGDTVFTASEVDGKCLCGLWFPDPQTIAICPLAALSRVLTARTAKPTSVRAATIAMPAAQAGMLVATDKALADVGLANAPAFTDASYVRLNLDIANPATMQVSAVYSTSQRADAAAAQWQELVPAAKALIDNAVDASRNPHSPLQPDALRAVSEVGGSLMKSIVGVQVATRRTRVDASLPLSFDLDMQAIESLMLVPTKVIDRLTLKERDALGEDEDPPPPTLRRFDMQAAQTLRKTITQDDAASELFRQIPQATGFPAAHLLVIGNMTVSPRLQDFPEQPLLSLFFAESPYADSLVDRRTGLYFSFEARPSEYFLRFRLGGLPFGTGTLINCEDIESFECTRDGETANGRFTFESRMVKGSVPFAARRWRGRWEFMRFDLPAWGLECRRNKAGKWEMADEFGRIGSTEPTDTVRITVARDGVPLTDLRGVHLYRDPQLFYVRCDMRNGSGEMPLFPGRYFVELDSGKDDLPERYLNAATSGLTITVPQKGDGAAIVIAVE